MASQKTSPPRQTLFGIARQRCGWCPLNFRSSSAGRQLFYVTQSLVISFCLRIVESPYLPVVYKCGEYILKMSNFVKIATCCVVFLVCAGKSTALNCYQCSGSDSSKPFQCNEWLSSDIDIKPESCDNVHGARYCVKHVGRYEGGIGAKRFCSSLDLGNYCNYVKQPGDTLTYRTCIYTCTGDGCNSGKDILPNIKLILHLLLIVSVFTYFR